MPVLPIADSSSDAAVSDAAMKNANCTKSTNYSSSNSANSVDDEEDADATTESTSSTSGKILAADDKDIEEVPDYNELVNYCKQNIIVGTLYIFNLICLDYNRAACFMQSVWQGITWST